MRGQETLRKKTEAKHIRQFGFNEKTNSYTREYGFYRRPRIPETTIFSIPVDKIKKAIKDIFREMERAERINPFSRQIHDAEDPQT